MSSFQKWFTENIGNGLVAIFELFLLASVRETVWGRAFLTSFKSYPSWRKWQNNLILMVAETGNRVFASECRTAPQNHLQFIFALCSLHELLHMLGWSGSTAQRKGKHITDFVSIVPCLVPPIFDVVCSVDVSRTSLHNLPVYFFMFIQNGNLFFLTNLPVLFWRIAAMTSAKGKHLWVVDIYIFTYVSLKWNWGNGIGGEGTVSPTVSIMPWDLDSMLFI